MPVGRRLDLRLQGRIGCAANPPNAQDRNRSRKDDVLREMREGDAPPAIPQADESADALGASDRDARFVAGSVAHHASLVRDWQTQKRHMDLRRMRGKIIRASVF